LTTESLLTRAHTGFQSVDVDPAIKESALSHLEKWLTENRFANLSDTVKDDYFPLLEWVIVNGHFDLLLDSFYQVMPFGTGGRRGPVGIGPNRINPYTIASSVQGHVKYLQKLFPKEKQPGVVIGYDVREYNDLRGLYPQDVSNPLLGLSSRDLAHIATSIYCAAGIKTYILPDNPKSHISTPELSFLIRFLGVHGGLNISASHNHPDDNGSKFYNAHGGQEIPPHDEHLVHIVEKITGVQSIPYTTALQSGLVKPITEQYRREYVNLNLKLRLRTEAGPAKIVFTPLHGTGGNTVGRCLQEAGFEPKKKFFAVEEQLECRGDFASVKFRSPNPEVPESLEAAIALAKKTDADIVLATDPDADRIGAAVKRGDDIVAITGNELAIILTRYRLETLRHNGQIPKHPVVIKTEVTTELVTRIASDFEAQIIGDLLVGFKYVGDILHHLELTGNFREIKGGLDDFVIAAEESHGFLLTPHIRDKDATGAALVLADLASDVKERGQTIYDYLMDTYKRYGYHCNSLRSTIMQGATGMTAMRTIQDGLRENPPTEIEGLKLLACRDHWDKDTFGNFKSMTDRNARNLITLIFEENLRVTVRPSGTEPKNKVYIEKGTQPLGVEVSNEEFEHTRQQVDREVAHFSQAFMKSMLAMIDVVLPDYAMKISDLVPLDQKLRFVESFIPAFEDRVHSVELGTINEKTVSRWIDNELKGYGPDSRQLLAPAFEAYLGSKTSNNSTTASMRKTQREIFLGLPT